MTGKSVTGKSVTGKSATGEIAATGKQPAPPPVISVVIAHLNQPDMLGRCLASLAAGTRQPDEVLVVDNGSARMPAAECAAYPAASPRVTLLHEATPGPGPARSFGAARARGDILAFIDADCLADPGWLAAAEAAMADPAAQILGGDVRIAYVDPDRLTVLEAYESVFGYRVREYIAREGFTVTCNLVTRPAVMAAVGPFAGLSVAEDRDWGQRATAMGYVIRYTPQMRVYHPARVGMAALRVKWDRHMAHDFEAARHRRHGMLRWSVKTVAMGISPLAEIARILRSDRISGGRNLVLAFAGLVRIRLYRARMMVWLLAGGDPARLAGRWNRPPGQ